MSTIAAWMPIGTTSVTQRELFPVAEEKPPAPAAPVSLYAEIVFDRPLDQAYTYGVPDSLLGSISIGGRVLAPFGKGNRPTPGFCVGLTDKTPSQAAKRLIRVLDDRALVTPELMRLTRWMADYYLCGWGQVLNAVVPAGGAASCAGGASGSRRFTRARNCPWSYRSSQYDSVRRSSRLASRRALTRATIAIASAAPVITHSMVTKLHTLSNGLQQCQPPETIPRFSPPDVA